MEMRIVLDKPSYSPGECVLGKVILVRSGISMLSKPVGLRIQFEGKAQVKFTLSDKWGYKSGRRTHVAAETYFHFAHYLVGDGQTEMDEFGGGGMTEFPFSYTLPPLLPSSYKGSHGSVDYTITAILKRSWGVHKEAVQVFQVNSELDVATFHLQRRNGELGSMRKSERVGMLWWSGTVFVHLNLRKRAYVSGEHLHFSAQIINDSKSNLHRAKLILTQEVRYFAQGALHVVSHILKKVKGPRVKGGERTVVWEDPTVMKIPPLTPTDLGGGGLCTLMEVNYFVMLLIQPSSLTWKDRTVLCKLPITVGTKRGVSGRESWCMGDTMTSRVGSIFGTLERSSIAPSNWGEWSYYQNVVYPLNRCFSAPLYENHRFRAGHISPFSEIEGEEEDEEPPRTAAELPPSYEQAMEEYQNTIMSSPLTIGGFSSRTSAAVSPCPTPIHAQPIYNNQ